MKTISIILVLFTLGATELEEPDPIKPIRVISIKEERMTPEEARNVVIEPVYNKPCGKLSELKTYMSYKKITNKSSKQYKLQRSSRLVPNKDGIITIDGYLGVAMGRHYGKVGDKLEIQLTSGQTIKVIIMDIKHEGCSSKDGSNIEFLVDIDKVPSKYKRNNFQSKYKGVISKWRLL